MRRLTARPVVFINNGNNINGAAATTTLTDCCTNRRRGALVISASPTRDLNSILGMHLGGRGATVAPCLSTVRLGPSIVISTRFTRIRHAVATCTGPSVVPGVHGRLELSGSTPNTRRTTVLRSVYRRLITTTSTGCRRVVFSATPAKRALQLLMLPRVVNT